MRKPTQTKSAAFTLVEIMIVVAIIALLAMIAVPSWLRSRMRSQNAMFINDLRVFSDALNVYAVENKSFPEPPDFPTGSLTNGVVDFTPYVKDPDYFARPPSVGGTWDIMIGTGAPGSIRAAVGSDEYGMDALQMELLDKLGDDDDVTTGGMRIVGTGYYYIVEETP